MISAGTVVSASQQCTEPHIACSAATSHPVITQTPYSLDLNPTDFWLFPTLNMDLMGTHFATMEDIKSSAMAKLPEESKTTIQPVLPTMVGSMAQVCVCARAHKVPTFKVIKVITAVWPTIIVQYHH
jgi:hypothetical protein